MGSEMCIRDSVDIVLTDDGLQHYALQRDIEIILFDGRGAGNGWLLPAGPLREPVSRRRDFTVINAPLLTEELVRSVGAQPASQGSYPVRGTTPVGGADSSGQPVQMTLEGGYAEQLRDRSQRRELAALNQPGLRLAAAAGIGNPSRFSACSRPPACPSPSCLCPIITTTPTARSRGWRPISS